MTLIILSKSNLLFEREGKYIIDEREPMLGFIRRRRRTAVFVPQRCRKKNNSKKRALYLVVYLTISGHQDDVASRC